MSDKHEKVKAPNIRVHQYAECAIAEADMRFISPLVRCDNGEVMFSRHTRLGGVPVRYLGVIEMPAPVKSRDKIIYRFEPVEKPEQDGAGRWWYDSPCGPQFYIGTTMSDMTEDWLRCTFERIATKPDETGMTAHENNAPGESSHERAGPRDE